MTRKSIATLSTCVLLLSTLTSPIVAVAESANINADVQETVRTEEEKPVEPIADPTKTVLEGLSETITTDAPKKPEKTQGTETPITDTPKNTSSTEATKSSTPVEKSEEKPTTSSSTDNEKVTPFAIDDKVDVDQLQNIYYQYGYDFLNNEELYTSDSWQVFLVQLEKAKEIVEDNWQGAEIIETQAEVDKVMTDLQNSIEVLVLKTEEKSITKLTNLVTKIKEEKLKKTDYTYESWSDFSWYFEQSKTILTDFSESLSDNWDQLAINDAEINLERTHLGLVKKVVNPTTVNKIITTPSDKSLYEEGYSATVTNRVTVEIWQSVFSTKDTFNIGIVIDGIHLGIIEEHSFNEDFTITADRINDSLKWSENVSEVTTDLVLNVKNGFAKEAIKKQIAVTKYNFETPSTLELQLGYTVTAVYVWDGWGDIEVRYITPLEEQSATISDGEVLSFETPNGPVHVEFNLSENTVVDKTQLDAYLKWANGKNRLDYTEKSWNVLKEAYISGKRVLKDESVSQAQINAQVDLLTAGATQLERVDGEAVEIDKSDLKYEIEQSERLLEKRYTTGSWRVLESALKVGREIFSEEKATAVQIEFAHGLLVTARNNLVFVKQGKLDKEGLIAAITKGEKIEKGDYSAYTWNKLQYSIEDGKNYLEYEFSEEMAQFYQENIDGATLGIERNIKELKEKVVSTQTIKKEETLTGTKYYFNLENDPKVIQVDQNLTAYFSDSSKANVGKYFVKFTLKNAKGEENTIGYFDGAFGEKLVISNDELNESIEVNNDSYESKDKLLSTSYEFVVHDKRSQEIAQEVQVVVTNEKNNTFHHKFSDSAIQAGYDVVSGRIYATFLFYQGADLIGFFQDKDSVIIKTETGLVKLIFTLNRLSKVDYQPLQELFTLAVSTNTDSYTADSGIALQEKLASAGDLIYSETLSDQAELDNAYNELQEAMDNLEVNPGEEKDVALFTTELAIQIQRLQTLKKADYTASSWSYFSEQLSKGKEILAKYEGKKGTPIDQARIGIIYTSLNSAAYVLIPVDPNVEVPQTINIENLVVVINRAKGLNSSDFTEASWKAVERDLVSASEIIAKATAVPSALVTQKDVDDMVVVLEGSIDALVKKEVEKPAALVTDNLSKRIKEAKQLKEAEYTDASWKVLEGSLAKAEAMLASAEDQNNQRTLLTQKDVDDMVVVLEGSIDALVKKEVEKPTALVTDNLSKRIKEAKQLKAAEYTDASWKVLEGSLAKAEAMLASAEDQNNQRTLLTQKDVDDMVVVLEGSIDALVKKEVEKPTALVTDNLSKRIKEAKQLKVAEYTDASWKVLEGSLAKAEAMLASAEDQNNQRTLLTQKDVDDMVVVLEGSIDALVKKEVEKPTALVTDNLSKRIKEAKQLKAAEYTDASWKVLEGSLAKAEAMLVSAEAQNNQRSLLIQKDVDQVESDLTNALNALVAVKVDSKTPEPEGPANTNGSKKPVKPTDSKDKVGSKPTTPKTSGTKLPQTNEIVSVLPNLVGAGAVIASVVAFFKGRKKK